LRLLTISRLLTFPSANSGAMHEDNDELNNIIPIDAFDANPVEPYKPCYDTEVVNVMLTKGEWSN
jgi:hypothetical protein